MIVNHPSWAVPGAGPRRPLPRGRAFPGRLPACRTWTEAAAGPGRHSLVITLIGSRAAGACRLRRRGPMLLEYGIMCVRATTASVRDASDPSVQVTGRRVRVRFHAAGGSGGGDGLSGIPYC